MIPYGSTGYEHLTMNELERLLYIEPDNMKASLEQARRACGGLSHGDQR